jgi:hypothetical protein
MKWRTIPQLVCCFAAVLMSGCFAFRDEVARSTAPSGRVDAVLVETNGGAITSFGYFVFVVPTGRSTWFKKEVAFLYGATRNSQAFGANLNWTGNSELKVEYLDAREAELRLSRVLVLGKEVRIILKSGIIDPSAPPGGMLYNLRARPYG